MDRARRSRRVALGRDRVGLHVRSGARRAPQTVITFAAVASTAAFAWLRFALGSHAAIVPWLGLAWTLLFARHSRRGAFALYGLSCGAIDGLVAPAAWTIWPVAYLVVGTAAFATRRVLPVRGMPGELVIGIVATILIRVLVIPFEPLGLSTGFGSAWPAALSAASTGVACAALLWLSRRWVALRMRLTSVT